jgi:serine/threonine-protein kinase RsbW
MSHEPAIRLTLRNEPSATMELRTAVDKVARRCGMPREETFDLKLAATEALTNALKGTPDGHAVDVILAGGDETLEIEVADRSAFRPSVQSDASAAAEGGRGIPLMLALVDEVEFASTGDGTRVRVRKRVPRDARL